MGLSEVGGGDALFWLRASEKFGVGVVEMVAGADRVMLE